MFARAFAVRRLLEKSRRRLRCMAGKPDNSPWVFDPPRPRRSAYVDVLVALDYLSPNARLARLLHDAFGPLGLSLQIVNNFNIDRIHRQITAGRLCPHVYLDLSSRPGDPYEQLLYAAAKAGSHTIRKPAHTRWVLKSLSHPVLAAAGLPVPPSVILKSDEPDRDLTPDEKRLLGHRVVIKPSFGEAAKGVLVNIHPTKDNIASARNYNRDFDWLIQKQITWMHLGHRPAYLRAYYCCGHRTLLWWCKENGHEGYDLLTWSDLHRHDLLPAVEIIDRLADLTGMDFFSSEIAITQETGPDRFVLIDYINDQCDMDPHAHPRYSPPEPFARWAAQRLAEFTFRKKHNLPPPTDRHLHLYDNPSVPTPASDPSPSHSLPVARATSP
jgi:hypothetical protein